MKRIILTILAVTCLPALVAAQEQGWGAKFFKDGITHDFGNVPYGSKLTYKFPITNIYNEPFIIKDATASCGCVTPKKPAQQIPPRGASELEISMDTLRITPPAFKTVNVTVILQSVPAQPGGKVYSSVAVLTVSCTPKTDIVFNPGELNFGVVNQGQTPKLVLNVEHAGNPSWRITGIVKNDYPVDVAAQQAPARAQGFVNYQVMVTLKANAAAGEFKHEIQLQTNDQQTPVLNVVVTGVVQAPLVATPNNIDFAHVKVNEVVSRYVVVRASKPFMITDVAGVGGGITVKKPDKPSTAQILTIEFLPGQAGNLKKVLTVKTDLEGDLSTTVTVEGTAMP